MKKIKNLFVRNTDGKITSEINPESKWVEEGEGVATRKYDGTACLWKDGKLWKRYDCKKGKLPPPDFAPCQEPDAVTGHWPGWVPVGNSSADKWFNEALKTTKINFIEGATYELCGERIGTNGENIDGHEFFKHGAVEYPNVPRDYDRLKKWLKPLDIEGIVWHHPDGRMVKVRKCDFGLSRR